MKNLSKGNIWQIYGRVQISIQIIFWIITIYICNFNLIFECFENSITQFILLFIFVYNQICALRNFYLGVQTSSEVISKLKEEKEQNNLIRTTLCKKCGIERPLRSHHCSICNICIERMDHHCYFLNNCIGKKNYKYFFIYLFFGMINSLGSIILGCYRFYLSKYYKSRKINNATELKEFLSLSTNIILLLLICIPTFLGCIYLLIYHLFLIYKGQTTIERVYPKLYIKEEMNEKIPFYEKFRNLMESDNL